jgi:uncharacterized protein YecT (DUF1311 family)
MRMLLPGVLLIAIGACAQPSRSNKETTIHTRADGQSDLSNPALVQSPANASTPKNLAIPTVRAHDNVLRDSYYKCAESNDGSTWDMQKCIETEFDYQDARLNYAYKSLRSKVFGEEARKLRIDERRWLSDMGITCRWNAETEGQAQRIEANECSLEKTARRAKKLEGQLHRRDKP